MSNYNLHSELCRLINKDKQIKASDIQEYIEKSDKDTLYFMVCNCEFCSNTPSERRNVAVMEYDRF